MNHMEINKEYLIPLCCKGDLEGFHLSKVKSNQVLVLILKIEEEATKSFSTQENLCLKQNLEENKLNIAKSKNRTA